LSSDEVERQVARVQVVFSAAFVTRIAVVFAVSAAFALDGELRCAQELLVVMLQGKIEKSMMKLNFP
jgi:hypothetical protein